jgi:hypothetical protein
MEVNVIVSFIPIISTQIYTMEFWLGKTHMLLVHSLFYFLFGLSLCPAWFINLHHESPETGFEKLLKVQKSSLKDSNSTTQGKGFGTTHIMVFILFLVEWWQSHFSNGKKAFCLGKCNFQFVYWEFPGKILITLRMLIKFLET